MPLLRQLLTKSNTVLSLVSCQSPSRWDKAWTAAEFNVSNSLQHFPRMTAASVVGVDSLWSLFWHQFKSCLGVRQTHSRWLYNYIFITENVLLIEPGTNTTASILSLAVVTSSNPRSRFANRQLVCLLPVGFVNYVTFIWNICFPCFSGMPVN